MGAAKQRKAAFLAAHPLCCFCGGQSPSETIDHVPSRATFAGGIGPEGFEFPACKACNSGSSQSEQIFALYARLFDDVDESRDKSHVQKLIGGVHNNQPHLIPNPNLSANSKRQALKRYRWELPRGSFLDDLMLVGIPKSIDVHMELAAIKLLAALHYRHVGTAITPEQGVFWTWSEQGLPDLDEVQETLLDGMPDLVIGNRINTDIGNQFAYRFGNNADEELFAYAAGFGAGIFLFAATAPWKAVAGKEDWDQFSTAMISTRR